LLGAKRRKMPCFSGGALRAERPADEPVQIAGNGTGTLRRAGGLPANWWTSQRWKESNEYREVGMFRLLKIALVVGLSTIPSHAQRAMSSGRSGGFSAPRGFAPAPHMSGGFNRRGMTFGVRSGFVGTPTLRGFNASPTYRRNTLIPSRGVSSPRSFGNWHGPPLPNWRHTYGYRYRRPYGRYFYGNSVYLVPGLLNSYWNYPDDFGANDGTPYFNQPPIQGNYFQPDPGYGSGDQGPRSGQRPEYRPKDVPPPPPAASEPLPLAALTLIFKDGHSQQIHNYAMTRTKIYVLDDAAAGRTFEIPLNTIDLQATEETNRQAGVDFSIPVLVNGQAKN